MFALREVEDLSAQTLHTEGLPETVLAGIEEDRFLPAGSFVKLAIMVNGKDMLEPDYGIVLRCWMDTDKGMHDCLVAFGRSGPRGGRSDEETYLATFPAGSLAQTEGL